MNISEIKKVNEPKRNFDVNKKQKSFRRIKIHHFKAKEKFIHHRSRTNTISLLKLSASSHFWQLHDYVADKTHPKIIDSTRKKTPRLKWHSRYEKTNPTPVQKAKTESCGVWLENASINLHKTNLLNCNN